MAKRVLVVAGREGVAPALQTQIEIWGGALDFALATSANEALWEVRGSPYDLVLAPWQLPEMTGLEFAEVVQALSPATRLILIGVPVTPALQNQAKSLGVYALLAQATPQEIAGFIGRALEIPLPQPRPAPLPRPTPPPARETPTAAPAPPAKGEAPPPAAPAQPKAPTAAAPAAAARPKAPPTAPPAPRVTLTPAQQQGARQSLQDLLVSIGPQVAFLISTAGDLLASEGSAGDLDLVALAARAVPSLAGSDGLARALGDDLLSSLYLFTGSRYDLYAFTVTRTIMLLFIFDKTVVEGKLGSVWLYTRRVVEGLRESLSP